MSSEPIPTELTEEEAMNLDHVIRSMIGEKRAFIIVIVDCGPDRTIPYVMSNLATQEQCREVLEGAIETMEEVEADVLIRGPRA